LGIKTSPQPHIESIRELALKRRWRRIFPLHLAGAMRTMQRIEIPGKDFLIAMVRTSNVEDRHTIPVEEWTGHRYP
jgi:hypothetical protein